MDTYENEEPRAPEPGGLTTEDLAHPGTSTDAGMEETDTRTETGTETDTDTDTGTERQAPLYPGEATPEQDRTDTAPADADADDAGDGVGDDVGERPLLAPADAEAYRTSWSEIQGRFVDDPQEAVKSADALVAEVMRTLAGTFSTHKQELEGQWDRGEQVATEDLRLALQRYRSFFNRLLNT